MFSMLKRRSAIRAESEKLVELIRTKLPVESGALVADERLSKKSASAVRQVIGAAASFSSGSELGYLSRAYLANCVKWGLRDIGYAREFVDDIAAGILIATGQTA